MSALRVMIAPFLPADLAEVLAIEKVVDPSPWAEPSFRNEIETNNLAHYFTARYESKIVGYAGFWLVIDEAHITKVTTHPDFRRRSIGQQMLRHLLMVAVQKGATRATLELRVSNEAARNLYEKFGFTAAGIRKNYYLDNLEDATIMWSENLSAYAKNTGGIDDLSRH